MTFAYAIVALVVIQRVGELWFAARNTRALRARGGIEYGRRQDRDRWRCEGSALPAEDLSLWRVMFKSATYS
jgi:hypothetical protein